MHGAAQHKECYAAILKYILLQRVCFSAGALSTKDPFPSPVKITSLHNCFFSCSHQCGTPTVSSSTKFCERAELSLWLFLYTSSRVSRDLFDHYVFWSPTYPLCSVALCVWLHLICSTSTITHSHLPVTCSHYDWVLALFYSLWWISLLDMGLQCYRNYHCGRILADLLNRDSAEHTSMVLIWGKWVSCCLLHGHSS